MNYQEDISIINKLKDEYEIELSETNKIEDYKPNSYVLKNNRVVSLSINDIKLNIIPECIGRFECLEKLVLSNINISDLSTLNELSNLKVLEAARNNINEICDLKGLVNLRKLNLWGNNIVDISLLSVLKNLRYLNLSFNRIEDISVLNAMEKLQVALFDNNKISDVPNLNKKLLLKKLTLSSNDIKKIIGLKDLTCLFSLDIDDNQIEDISPLDSLVSLRTLYIRNNMIKDITILRKLENLKHVILDDNQIEDISPLDSLVYLLTLSISFNRIEDILPLARLVRLRKLNIGNNKIKDISILRKIENLKHIFLENNQIEDITILEKMNNLKSLTIDNNHIKDITVLRKLKHLKSLSIDNNHIKDLLPLENLENLKELSANNNLIKDISILEKVNNLVELLLNNNQIEDITILEKLECLHTLFLDNNQITNISSLEKLKNLYILTLESNNIIDISSIGKLEHLKLIRLNNNQIRNVQAFMNLTELSSIDLENNKITQFPKFILDCELNLIYRETAKSNYISNGINLHNNPIEDVPIEILHQSKEAVGDYFTSLAIDSSPINEIKVIFLGEGASGKTSLMNYLLNKPYDKNQQQTHGINIGSLKENNITMRIWDFGGQEIMHHTHQFFLTQKSVYVLVINARENTDTEKWLKLIDVFGGNSPVIIVTNKIDENPSSHENIKYLNKKYPNIKGRYVRISCETGTGLEDFKEMLIESIRELPYISTLWGKSWLNTKEELEKMKSGESMKDYIHYDKYIEICEKNGVPKTHQETLIAWLHQLGVVTYFSDTNLSETNVINPSWLTEAFYSIINSKSVAQEFGLFNISNLSKILCLEKYPKYKHSYLVQLLVKFELCFKIDENYFLIPDLLNREEPNFDFDTSSSLKFKFKYSKLLPKSILPKFIVRRHKEIDNDYKWRTGLVVFDFYFESKALIRVDEEEKEISIYVNGKERRGYLASIISTFEEINNIYLGLEYEKLVPCCCSQCKNNEYPYYFDYDVLLRQKEKIRYQICNNSDQEVLISDLLGILITNEELKQEIEKTVGKGFLNTKYYLESCNPESFIQTVESLFASVSYLLFEKSEKAYHTPLILLLRAAFGSNARADEIQAKGRTDIVIDIKNYIYILELKLNDCAQTAIDQIYEKEYCKPYDISNKKIILIGINFDSNTRNISEYIIEEYKKKNIHKK